MRSAELEINNFKRSGGASLAKGQVTSVILELEIQVLNEIAGYVNHIIPKRVSLQDTI
jgi:hypothetical protein